MIPKKNLLASYWDGITDQVAGEQYGTIVRYVIPEFLTNLMLYAMPLWIDAFFISKLSSTATYATLGVTNVVIHLIIKVAEALSVGTVVLSGQFNGKSAYQKVGQTVQSAFWLTCFTGLIFAAFLYFGAYWIYWWYGVEAEIIEQGVPFLRLRAIGVLFMFIYLAFIGFLKGIKNTRSPMKIFLFGSVVFIVCDYLFIFGNSVIPAMGLRGSAIATVVQYAAMLFVVTCYVLSSRKNRKYGIFLFAAVKDFSHIKNLIAMSLPVICDKATIALAYLWLGKMIAPMGTWCFAAFCAMKDLERFAFLPAIACAQVITFLVSNDFGARRWDHIKANIKKIIFISSCAVVAILICLRYWLSDVLAMLDKKGEFSPLVAYVFPVLSLLVFFDLLQIILSGALRGTGNMKTVMIVRVAVCVGYFIPLSYMLSLLPITDISLKFMLIYGSFYVGNALMSIVYINRFRTDEWRMPLT